MEAYSQAKEGDSQNFPYMDDSQYTVNFGIHWEHFGTTGYVVVFHASQGW